VYARAVDDAAERLRELRHEECSDLGLAALTFALAVAATRARPDLVVPLLLGGLTVGALGLRAGWRRWDLIDRLAGEGDAHVITAVHGYASQQATMERRQSFAAMIRNQLPQPDRPAEPRIAALADELEELVSELEDPALALHPACAVACMRLLSDVVGSPLLNPASPTDELRSRVCQIRSGFRRTSAA
jgi:hypothetical protein